MLKTLNLIWLAAAIIVVTASNPIPTYTKKDLMGKFNPSNHDDFISVPQRYASKSMYLRKETLEAFKRMSKAAAEDGVDLIIVSGTRNRSRQLEIWNEKWNRFRGSDVERAEEILLYSSMPGTSRHHWGTDIDINSVDPDYFKSGRGAKEYDWLSEHAIRFGFFQPYTAKDEKRKEGYREEKWHWSYYPVSNQLLKAYKRMISYDDIKGFPGSGVAEDIRVLDRFVMGIPDLNEQHNGFFQLED